MKKQTKIIALGLVIILVGLWQFGMLPLSGINIDTDTQGFEFTPDWTTPYNSLYGCDSSEDELTDETRLVTVMYSDGGTSARSTKLGLNGKIWIGGIGNNPSYGRFRLIGNYWFNVYIKDEDHSSWFKIMGHNHFDGDYLYSSTEYEGEYYLDGIEGTSFWDNFYCDYDGDGEFNDEIFYAPAQGQYYHPGGINIQLIKSHVGAMKVELVANCVVADLEFWSPGLHNYLNTHTHEEFVLQSDELELVSGKGDVWIEGESTVFEEGDTVTFGIETGYSGATQGGSDSNKGWELRIYKPDTSGAIYTIPIGDDYRGSKTYTIPTDAYNPTGSNNWRVELWNTLFSQKDTEFFAIGEGMMEQIPGTPEITFNKESYNIGDTCFVDLYAEPNPDGRNSIYEFYVKAYYSGTNEYLYSENYIRAYSNSASFSFTCTRGDRYVKVEAVAYDLKHDQGGLPSNTGRNSFYVKDKFQEPDTYTLVVYVRDFNNELVEGATVECDMESGTTDSNGKFTFTHLPKDDYVITARKNGVGSGTVDVNLDSDKSVKIVLHNEESSMIKLIISIIIIIVYLAVAFLWKGIPYGIIGKIVIIAIGVIIAVLYYFMI